MTSQREANPPPFAVASRLATSYMASHALHVASRLGIPDILGHGLMTFEEIAESVGAKAEMMRRLLRALAAFDVVKDLGTGQYELTPVGHCLRSDAPTSVRPLVEMFGSQSFLQTFESLDDCVKTGRNAYENLYGLDCSFAYYEQHPDVARIFDNAMSALSSRNGPAIADTYDFSTVEHVVDVGGGQGQILSSILKAHPHLRGTLFDLPRMSDKSRAFLEREAVADRCEVVEGDMLASVPSHGDVYLLCHVIHDWDDEHAEKALLACRRAMPPESRIVIFDRVMPERIEVNPENQANVLIDLRMLVGTRGGRERTKREFESLLEVAGFRLHRILPTRMPSSLVEAHPA